MNRDHHHHVHPVCSPPRPQPHADGRTLRRHTLHGALHPRQDGKEDKGIDSSVALSLVLMAATGRMEGWVFALRHFSPFFSHINA